MTKQKSNKGQKTLAATTSKHDAAAINVRTYEAALASFFTNAALSNADESAIKADVAAIRSNQEKMMDCALTIGEKLQHIRATLGAEKFSTFATNVVPRMGLSRSACYRYLGAAEKITTLVSNPTARRALYLLTDGRNVTVTDDKGKVDVTPAFAKALKAVPMPSGTLDDKGAEEWALRVQKVMGQSGANEKKTATQKEKEACDRIIASVLGYADKFGIKAAESMLKTVINKLDEKKKTIIVAEPKGAAAAAPASK